MEVVLNIKKSVEQNAEIYFDKAKKYKKKIPGIEKTIKENNEKISKIERGMAISEQENSLQVSRKKEWHDKFRWFISSNGFLVIGGRDATTNDIIIKKYMDQNDIVFHTELPGSPFVIIKNPDNKNIPETTIKEAGEFCASYSKSWKSSRVSAQVYHIKPEQVTKQALSGEYVAKGAFMIYGKRNYVEAALNIAICNDGRIIAGPISAIKNWCNEKKMPFVEIIQGNDKLSDVAKKVRKVIGGDLDEIIRSLPSECTIKKS